jgi:hypothetical protein
MASPCEITITMLRRSVPLLVFAIFAALVIFAVRQIPPWHAPWGELSLEHPIGVATHMKLRQLLDDEVSCTAALSTAANLRTRTALPDAGTGRCPLTNAVAFEQSTVSYGGAFAASCSLASALYIWEREALQPAALQHFNTNVERIDQIGSFACRNIYNRDVGRISQHASANALDIAGFRLANGERISVLHDWGTNTDKGRFLATLVESSCSIFSGVLTPAYNRAHRDHLHLDMGPYRICATGPAVGAPGIDARRAATRGARRGA